jgi:Fur family transcriptional regulator, peroxide stress response regulator
LLKKPAYTSLDPLERLGAACREHGIPVTVQRRAILTALLERHDHPTVDQIYDDVRARIPGVSRTTVYRTLERLADLGLARRTNHFAASARFDGNLEQHHHLVCIKCNKVIDFKDPQFTIGELPDFHRAGFVMQDYSVYFEGMCRDCKSLTGSTKRRNLKKLRKTPRAGE